MGLREIRARNLARYRPETLAASANAIASSKAMVAWGLLTVLFGALTRPSVPDARHDWWSLAILALMLLVWAVLTARYVSRNLRVTKQARVDREEYERRHAEPNG
jgi:hypothetical protein